MVKGEVGANFTLQMPIDDYYKHDCCILKQEITPKVLRDRLERVVNNFWKGQRITPQEAKALNMTSKTSVLYWTQVIARWNIWSPLHGHFWSFDCLQSLSALVAAESLLSCRLLA